MQVAWSSDDEPVTPPRRPKNGQALRCSLDTSSTGRVRHRQTTRRIALADRMRPDICAFWLGQGLRLMLKEGSESLAGEQVGEVSLARPKVDVSIF